ncbi:sulfite exporter TauE/SafE family protein [Reinekea marinisedimentorum]|uniref:Probable membrane transporter protein n=1 Tax=Reinekea marinisedimentorum TaxID=230495 RepID=A0A4R3I193_9GAMM|nr:sulfite exporter TauE/SafE family protein [Reinekea marinisedimentorum]TCS38964.1 putative membrane protein YfcA [Reinekea marinisedimentorum]
MSELIEAWPIGLALIFTGMFAGTLAGLLGVGGGIVIVPVLYFLLQGFGVSAASAMAIATATSLATIVPTAISSVRSHYKKGNVDVELLKFWSGIILLSAVVGSVIATNISGNILTWMFGIIALIVSLNILFRSSAPPLFPALPGKAGQTLMATSVGGLSVMVGIGGGTIGVPLLLSFNFNAHKAVGTAAAFGLLIALPGVLTLLAVGQTPVDAPVGTWRLVNIPAFICIVPLTVWFAPLGAKIASKLEQKQLKRVFAIVLFITGSRMLLQVAMG